MWRITLLATLLLCAACGPVKQPESGRTVAAYEVPLLTEQDRREFLDLVGRDARVEGLHVDASSADELAQTAKNIPLAAMTMHAAVWRGAGDDQSEVVIQDAYDHLGGVWIVFLRGEDPALASRFRERATRTILARWPGTLTLPVMPSGAIPNTRDLVRTPKGYEVNPTATGQYRVSPSS